MECLEGLEANKANNSAEVVIGVLPPEDIACEDRNEPGLAAVGGWVAYLVVSALFRF